MLLRFRGGPNRSFEIFFSRPTAEVEPWTSRPASYSRGRRRNGSDKTGRLVTEQNQHLIPESDLAEWDAAVEEYERKHGRREGTG
jgi:hypothetical protein